MIGIPSLTSISVCATLLITYFHCDAKRVIVMPITFDTQKCVVLFHERKKEWFFPSGDVAPNEKVEDAAKRHASDSAGVSGNLYLLDKLWKYDAMNPSIPKANYFYLMKVTEIMDVLRWKPKKNLDRVFFTESEMRGYHNEDVVENGISLLNHARVFLSRTSPYDGIGVVCTIPFTERYLMLEHVETKDRHYPSDAEEPQDEGNKEETAKRVATEMAGVVPRSIHPMGLLVNITTNAAHVMYLVVAGIFLENWKDSETYVRRWNSPAEISPYIGGNTEMPSYASRFVSTAVPNMLTMDGERIEIICVDFVNSRVLALDTDLFPDSFGVPFVSWVHKGRATSKIRTVEKTAMNMGGVKGKVYCLDGDLYLVEVKEIARKWPCVLVCRERKWLTFDEIEPKVSSERLKKFLRVFLQREPNTLPFDDVFFVCFKYDSTNAIVVLQTKKANDEEVCLPRGMITSTDEGDFIANIKKLAEEEAGVVGHVTPMGLVFAEEGVDRLRIILICTVRYEADVAGWEITSRAKLWVPGKTAYDYFRANPNAAYLTRVLKAVLKIPN